MAKSDKIKKNVICYKDKLQKIDNSYIVLYMNHLVKRFRNYNNDEFIITISGLNKFIDKDDKVLTYLFKQFKQNNFNLVFTGDEDNINQINIDYTNITTNKSYNFKYQIQDLVTIVELSSKTDIPIVVIFIMKIIAQIITKSKILYKAIVLDLDDTLWKGTLSEVGIDKIRENMYTEQGAPFIAFMKFVKTLANELGIFITICSRNDSKMVVSAIEELDDNIFPLKNQIDYIIVNNNDKSENIRKIAEQLSILPKSIVFIDDNQIIRDEVKHKLPEVFVPEWANHNELVTQLIAGFIFERFELSLGSQNRRKQYKIIQTERSQNSLPPLNIKVINDNKHSESIKLYSKSNQFKFSQNDDTFDDDAISLYFEIYRENGDNLGICSALTYTLSNNNLLVHNWAISCRFFEIGLEEFILIYLQKIAKAKNLFINYHNSQYNQKVSELLAKYSDAFKKGYKNDIIEIIFTNEIADNFYKNTNLSTI